MNKQMIFICCFKILPLFVYLRKSVKVTQGSLLQVYMDKLNEKEKIVGTKTMPNLYVISNSHYYKQELLEYFHAANIYLCSYKIIKNISLSLGTLVTIKRPSICFWATSIVYYTGYNVISAKICTYLFYNSVTFAT